MTVKWLYRVLSVCKTDWSCTFLIVHKFVPSSFSCPATFSWWGCWMVRRWILCQQIYEYPRKGGGWLCSSLGPRSGSPGDCICHPSQTACCWCTSQSTEEEQNFYIYFTSKQLWIMLVQWDKLNWCFTESTGRVRDEQQ